jgi:hypothetical protein
MTAFEDGPAKGQTLMLHRAPRFLRVTEDNGKWDALDQLADTPRPNEKLFVYEIVGEPSWIHIYKRGPGSGFYTRASYRFVAQQPEDETMRHTPAWRDWCVDHALKEKGAA